MATIKKFICNKCKKYEGNVGNLFNALLLIANNEYEECPRCGKDKQCKAPNLHLQLTFDFGLDAKDSRCVVLAAFTPKSIKEPKHFKIKEWEDKKGNPVEFYPFLVVLERHNDKVGKKRMSVWLPYWHAVGIRKGRKRNKKTKIMKYGQWAPFMDLILFRDLLRQARKKGFKLF